ncbi:MAG: S49 family peptidase [Capsulimonadaceae bacterium]|nr:S49 family peptidase [Capsulimonadaceae bacterium]
MSPKICIDGGALAVIAGIDSVWAIEPRAAAGLRKALDRLDFAAHSAEFAEAETDIAQQNLDARAEEGASSDRPYTLDDNGVACLCVAGVMTKRPVSWGQNTSTVLLRRAIRQAAMDEAVRAIALIVDSPGGQVSGTADLADEIRAARGRKPVGAYIEDVGCSAAYWAASQADFIYCNRTAQVGSIGTLLVVEDSSKAHETAGIAVHVIGTGKFKGAGVDGAPLTDDQADDFRRLTEEINAQFVSSVSLMRGISGEAISALEARTYVGKAAVAKGLVDKVASVDEFFAALHGTVGNEESHRLASGSPPVVRGPQVCDGDGVKGGTMDAELMEMCREIGITSRKELEALWADAALGRQYASQVRADAKGQAVRAYGPEVGLRLQGQCEVLPIDAVTALRDGWRAEADARYGIEAAGAVRKSAPTALNLPSATDGDLYEDGGCWQQLTDEQQAQAEKMGITDPALREAFAATVLTSAGNRPAFTKENYE